MSDKPEASKKDSAKPEAGKPEAGKPVTDKPEVVKKSEAETKASAAKEDKGTAKPQTPADPAQTHEVSKWKYTRPLTACRFDPSGQFVFTGAEDNTIQRWEVATGKLTSYAAHDSWVRAIGFSKDGQQVITGGYDGRLIWWPVAGDEPKPIRKLDNAHNGWIRAIAVSPDGKLIATCGNDNLVKLWDIADGSLKRELKGHENHVYNIAFHPTQPQIASCDLKGNVKVWDVNEGKMLREVTAAALHKYDTTFRADIGGARGIAVSDDGKRLAVSGITNVSNAFAGIGNPAVVSVDWESGKLDKTHVGKEAINGVAWGVRYQPAGFWIGLTGGGGGGFLFFWKPDSPNEFFKFKLPSSGRDLDLHSDGQRLAVAHSDTHIRIYAMAKKA